MVAKARFPSGGEYVEAIQNPRLCFSDPELKTAQPQVDNLGRPRPISGNFASVFSLTATSGARYAVKCFTREVPDQERRYSAISRHLRILPYDWKVGFDYQSKGVMVGGRWYPVLKMEWVEAVSLIRWIEEHLGDQAALSGLAERFAGLAADLEKAGVAHGDLQHGNILVADDGGLKLVDYDGMYVPSLSGLPATEKGHRHYQSPHRTDAEFGPQLDRFSVWLIYLSLVAIAVDPSLWRSLHGRDGEHLLLTDVDFTDAAASSRMASLVGHRVPDISRLATHVGDLATRSLSALPRLAPLPAANASAPAVRLQAPQVDPIVPGGLPAWMSGHLPSPFSPGPVKFGHHRKTLWSLRLTLTVLWTVPTIVALLGTVPGVVGVLFSAIGIALGFVVSRAVYTGLPESHAKKDALARSGTAVYRSAAAAGNVSYLEKKRDRHKSDEAARPDENALEIQEISDVHRDELADFDRRSVQLIDPLDMQIKAIADRQGAEIANALENARRDYVSTYLKSIELRPEMPPGVGEAIVAKLGRHGIRTPADFVDVRYVAGGHNRKPEVHFVLANGRSVHVHGIGKARAVALENWRQAYRRQAMQQPDFPNSLPRATRQQIESRYATERQKVERQRDAAERGRKQRRLDVVNRQTVEIKELTDRHAASARAAVQALRDLDQRLVAARVERQAASREKRKVRLEAQAYKGISYTEFLRIVLTGREPHQRP